MIPTRVKYDREARVLTLEWPGWGERPLSAWSIRADCRCASCVDEFTGVRLLDPDTVSPDIAIESLGAVGNYALKMTFTDGHSTGLFTWEHLAELGDRENPGS